MAAASTPCISQCAPRAAPVAAVSSATARLRVRIDPTAAARAPAGDLPLCIEVRHGATWQPLCGGPARLEVVLGDGTVLANGPPQDLALEESGPQRSVIRLRVPHLDAAGTPHLRSTLRLHLYGEPSLIKLVHRLEVVSTALPHAAGGTIDELAADQELLRANLAGSDGEQAPLLALRSATLTLPAAAVSEVSRRRALRLGGGDVAPAPRARAGPHAGARGPAQRARRAHQGPSGCHHRRRRGRDRRAALLGDLSQRHRRHGRCRDLRAAADLVGCTSAGRRRGVASALLLAPRRPLSAQGRPGGDGRGGDCPGHRPSGGERAAGRVRAPLARPAAAWFNASGVWGELADKAESPFPRYERMLDQAYGEWLKEREQWQQYGFHNFGDYYGEMGPPPSPPR